MLGVGHGHALRCSFGLSARKEQAKRTCELFPLGSVSVMFHAAVVSHFLLVSSTVYME